MSEGMQGRTQAVPTSVLTPAASGFLQRKCACGGSSGIAGQCEECSSNQLKVQRHAENQDRSLVPSAVNEVLRSPGRPLDAQTRSFMEPRFGHDFSHVRVHEDAQAAESARAINALAYTVGRDVVFGAGQYAPTTLEGKRLLAHELTHVVQQQQNSFVAASTVGSRIARDDSTAEAEADFAAGRLLAGGSVVGQIGRHAGEVQMQKAPGKCSNAAINNCTDEDLLTAICIGETGNVKDRAGQKGVMNVAMNRVAQGGFGADIRAVATAPGQFQGLKNGIRLLNESSFSGCRPLAQEVMTSPTSDPTAGAVFFDQSCSKPCDQYCTVYLGDGKTGAHYFARSATPPEKKRCQDKKQNPRGRNTYCCDTPKQRVYILPELEIIGERKNANKDVNEKESKDVKTEGESL